MSLIYLSKSLVLQHLCFVPAEGEVWSILLCTAPAPINPSFLRVSWSQTALRYFYFRVKTFPICLKTYCESDWAILSGNHMTASWGYGKVGKGGRHLIPLKWANKMSDPQTSREKSSGLLSMGLLQCGRYTRASCFVKQTSSCKPFLFE